MPALSQVVHPRREGEGRPAATAAGTPETGRAAPHGMEGRPSGGDPVWCGSRAGLRFHPGLDGGRSVGHADAYFSESIFVLFIFLNTSSLL